MYGVLENFENLILFTFYVNSQIPKGITKWQKNKDLDFALSMK